MWHETHIGNRFEQSARHPNILCFHQLAPSFSFGSTNFPPRRFAGLLERMLEVGYTFVTLAEALNRPLPTQVAITFDDGYAHLAENLPPLMERYDFRPTIFVPTAYIGKANDWDYSHVFRAMPHMSAEQIVALTRCGALFGSHGHRHRALTRLGDAELRNELARSKETLENLTGSVIDVVSYPFGRYSDRVMSAARKAGYRYGFTMSFPKASDPALAIGRYAIHGFDTRLAVLSKLNHGALYSVEKAKAAFTSKLAGGTILWNRLRGRSDEPGD